MEGIVRRDDTHDQQKPIEPSFEEACIQFQDEQEVEHGKLKDAFFALRNKLITVLLVSIDLWFCPKFLLSQYIGPYSNRAL